MCEETSLAAGDPVHDTTYTPALGRYEFGGKGAPRFGTTLWHQASAPRFSTTLQHRASAPRFSTALQHRASAPRAHRGPRGGKTRQQQQQQQQQQMVLRSPHPAAFSSRHHTPRAHATHPDLENFPFGRSAFPRTQTLPPNRRCGRVEERPKVVERNCSSSRDRQLQSQLLRSQRRRDFFGGHSTHIATTRLLRASPQG